MKKEWSHPELEVLDVAMTLKGTKPPKPPVDGNDPDPPIEEPDLDS
ncbi:paeninodin family lasso peptide [Sutcliffiella rhizosphaerae]|uniref:Paeninodin family lasso peptide n=1 Tax=Sutcliffiella rhizosphaerae TaxID=2880967 RepID=A0ABM8YLK2_9BACI|nr:paeninodin family lasso peptide [Sutcliffiella rhizosphaerae]CAG9620756.1 hypothetical protein BACCIP111883_01526 [Sutcliffiella rhizosphaerae]